MMTTCLRDIRRSTTSSSSSGTVSASLCQLRYALPALSRPGAFSLAFIGPFLEAFFSTQCCSVHLLVCHWGNTGSWDIQELLGDNIRMILSASYCTLRVAGLLGQLELPSWLLVQCTAPEASERITE